MRNGWTGGQYSLYRIIFGLYLLAHFLFLLPWSTEVFSNQGVLPADASPLLRVFPNILAVNDSPEMVSALIAIAAMASILFAAGQYSRIAAVAIWYVLACLFGRNPLIANPSLPFAGWLLLAHLFVPVSPYGSWPTRNAVDPRGGWSMPPAILAAAWIVMSLAYSYSGYEKLTSPSWADGTALSRVLANPLARPGFLHDGLLALPPVFLRIATWGALFLELGYAPLALIRTLRRWLWTAMLAMHIGLMTTIDFAELSEGMVILHLFTFNPAWVPDRWPSREDLLFYDGDCGLCHRWTRFVLSEDRTGRAFQFAPLQGNTFSETNIEIRESGVLDTILVKTSSGEFLERSDAVIYILERLGGFWRVLASVARIVPRTLRNAVYNFVARNRRRFFPEPKSLCPILPPELRARFRD